MVNLAEGIGLTLALISAESLPAPNGTMRCTLVLQNRGSRRIWVNQRMAVNHPSSPPHLREVDFLIRDFCGRVAEFTAKVRVGLPQSDDFVELAPGEAVEHPFDLAFWYALALGEEYEVEAIYENYFVPESLKDEPVWTGRLVSNALKMTLQAAARVLAS